MLKIGGRIWFFLNIEKNLKNENILYIIYILFLIFLFIISSNLYFKINPSKKLSEYPLLVVY